MPHPVAATSWSPPPGSSRRPRAGIAFLAYTFSVDLEDDDRIPSTEVWADQTALDEHMTHPHTQEFLAVEPRLVAGEPVVSSYDTTTPGGND